MNRKALYGVILLPVAGVLAFAGWKVYTQVSRSLSGKQTSARMPRKVKHPLELPLACFDRVDKRTRESLAYYEGWVVDMSAGPTCAERAIRGLHKLNSDGASRCRNAATFVRTFGVTGYADSLDALADRYAELFDTVAEAVAYYDAKQYEQDDCAKGKALHPKLVAQFEQTIALIDDTRAQTADYATAMNDLLRRRLRDEFGRRSPQIAMLDLALALDDMSMLFVDKKIDDSELDAFKRTSDAITRHTTRLEMLEKRIAKENAAATRPAVPKLSRAEKKKLTKAEKKARKKAKKAAARTAKSTTVYPPAEQKLVDAAGDLKSRLIKLDVKMGNDKEIDSRQWAEIDRYLRKTAAAARNLDFDPPPALQYATN